MGTHPIFESDFDCLTEMANFRQDNDFAPFAGFAAALGGLGSGGCPSEGGIDMTTALTTVGALTLAAGPAGLVTGGIMIGGGVAHNAINTWDRTSKREHEFKMAELDYKRDENDHQYRMHQETTTQMRERTKHLEAENRNMELKIQLAREQFARGQRQQ